jgi:phospholipid/cholesterol/gamma-HCH transport system substrate-binding protein
MSQRSMEMKVGGLIVASLVLLVGFIVLMGGLSLQPTFRVYVTFENPGGLQSGAPVRISGVRIGRVTAIEFRGGQLDEQGKPVPPIRVIADIEAQHNKAIYKDAKFFVTTQGMLGEMHLAVDAGNHQSGLLAHGSTVEGISPPRLDQLISESYELLHRGYKGVIDNEKEIGETFDGLHKTLHTTGRILEKHEEDLDRLVQRLDSIANTAEETLASAREQYVDGPRINRIMQRLDNTTKVVDENLAPILRDTRMILEDGRKLSAFASDDEQLATFRSLSTETRELLGLAKKTATDAQAIITHIKSGKGTAGSLIMDEAIYDDLQELMRDLKHNPWKIMWKE